LGETAGFFTDNQINQWLDDGVDDIAVDVEPLITTATVASVTSQEEYLLPTDHISVKKAFFLDSSSNWNLLEATTWEDLFEASADWEDDDGFPRLWYWRQDVIGIYPAPSSSYSGAGTLRILYSYSPGAMASDAATTGLPAFLDRSVVLYAVFRCYLKDKDLQRASGTAQEYRHQIAEAKTKLNRPRKGHIPHLVPKQRAYRSYYNRVWRRPVLEISS
jgi:hypothetical protein